MPVPDPVRASVLCLPRASGVGARQRNGDPALRAPRIRLSLTDKVSKIAHPFLGEAITATASDPFWSLKWLDQNYAEAAYDFMMDHSYHSKEHPVPTPIFTNGSGPSMASQAIFPSCSTCWRKLPAWLSQRLFSIQKSTLRRSAKRCKATPCGPTTGSGSSRDAARRRWWIRS